MDLKKIASKISTICINGEYVYIIEKKDKKKGEHNERQYNKTK